MKHTDTRVGGLVKINIQSYNVGTMREKIFGHTEAEGMFILM